MTDRFPDLEIYLMKPAPDAVRDWLAGALGSTATDISLSPGHSHWRFTVQGEAMDVFLNENAEKNFASLWFKQNLSPWNSDLDCARAAHAALAIEIRCSDSSWQEDEDEAEQPWIKLIRGEEKPLKW
ncbi:MAG: hypothetical protein CMI13_04720 [Oleibacter sp.]|nr:hypothetical protein [Thalassolituus sp.]